MSRIQVEPAPGDAKPFLLLVERTANAICESVDPGRVRVVRVDNWFGPRWLRFGMNLRGHALHHRASGVWCTEDDLRVPPFVPSRIASDVLWEYSQEHGAVRAADCGPLHVVQPGGVLGRRVREVEPEQSLLWYSGSTLGNGRGAIMAYIPSGSGHRTWYVELAGDRDWAVVTPRGTTKAEFNRLVSMCAE